MRTTMRSRASTLVAAAGAVALALPMLVAAGDASAAPRQPRNFRVDRVVAKVYYGPLQFSVHKQILVSEAFTSQLRQVYQNRTLFNGPQGGDVSGVDSNADSTLIGFNYSDSKHAANKFGVLHNGKLVFLTDLSAFERAHNPDGKILYGTPNRSACVAQALKKSRIPVRYYGEKDSHPYSVAYMGGTTWAVADAGTNSIFEINSATRSVRTLAVLPRQPFVVSPQFAKQNGLPQCVVGITYYTESVPTDVEYANGSLYATSLPGGPEAYGRGRVYRISPATGALTIIGKNFDDATNLAVSPDGRIWVAELGKGLISRLVDGKAVPVFKLPAVVALEWGRGHLYAAAAPAVFYDPSQGGPPPHAEIVELGDA